VDAEGWYVDPYGLHGERWFSDGAPTKLVRDDGKESFDPPPSVAPSGPLVAIAEQESVDGADLDRADDWQTKRTLKEAMRDLFLQTSQLS
jgi:hypothetical protein